MESSIKDKYIILGFVGFAIVLISSIATLVIADSFNQDNFVRWIVFVCCNLLGWLLYLSFQTLIFDTYEIYKIKFGKKETIAEAIEVQEELSQNTLEEATSVPGPTSVPEPVPPRIFTKRTVPITQAESNGKRKSASAWSWSIAIITCLALPTKKP